MATMVTDTGRRIHAAQAYGGFTSIAALAAKINRPGFGEGTIRRIVGGSRPLEDHERQWLEDATGVPAAFFERGFTDTERQAADEATLAGNSEKIDALVAKVEELRRALREDSDALLSLRSETLGRIYDRIANIDSQLVELTQRDTNLEAAVGQFRAFADAFGEPAAPPSTTPRPRRGNPRGTNPGAGNPGRSESPR